MQKYWNWLVTLVPLWVAPNLITIVGLAINILTSVILMYYSPTATEQAPWWATLLCAVGLFLYQSLDAIDGKQARRTGNSSPLGELFDHGCDSLSTVFVSIASCCAVQLGEYPGWMLFQCLTASTLFYCAHWQTYVSGTLTFGKIDVTEGQIVVMLVMVVSSIASFHNVDFWAANGTGVLSPMTPLLCVIVPAATIAFKSEEAVFHNHPILYVLLFGIIGAKITNRLVVAHMCKSEIHKWDPALLAPILLFLNQYFNNFLSEYYLLLFGFAWASFDLVWYCSGVCLEICNALNVYLFKIPAPGAQVNGASEKGGGPQTRQKTKAGKKE